VETAFESLRRLFEADDLKHHADYEQSVLIAGFEGRNAQFRVFFKVDEEDQLFQIFVLVPAIVPEGCRSAISEAIVRANHGMKVGSFEMDLSDGEIRFHIGYPFPDGNLDHDIVRRLIGTAIYTADRYFPAFMSIIYANDLPKDAIERAEKMPD
jgi:hypothetical protein